MEAVEIVVTKQDMIDFARVQSPNDTVWMAQEGLCAMAQYVRAKHCSLADGTSLVTPGMMGFGLNVAFDYGLCNSLGGHVATIRPHPELYDAMCWAFNKYFDPNTFQFTWRDFIEVLER